MACKSTQILIFIFTILMLPCNGVRRQQQLEQARRLFHNYDPNEVSQIYGVPEFPIPPFGPGGRLGGVRQHRKLGLRYDGTNQRVLYTGFRRSPADYLMIVPEKNMKHRSKPRFKLVSTVVDLEKTNAFENLLRQLRELNLSGKAAYKKSESNYLSGVKSGDRQDIIQYRYRPVKPIRSDLILRTTIGGEPSRNFSNFQRFHQDENVNQDHDESLQHHDREKSSDEQKKMDIDTTKQKLMSLLNTKDTFNHIKYSEDAPEYSNFIPLNAKKKLRDWWFFNQDDFGPFTQN
ncbi:unnamed protein product, partial [Iphiclides podalirius]